MKKIILCAVNAKFIHSSLAVHALAATTRDYREQIAVREFTIQHSADFILSELFRLRPGVVAFSCYIWNIDLILTVAGYLKKVLPTVKIILGGPEVSYAYAPLLAEAAGMIDYIVVGEGEATFRALAEHLLFGRHKPEEIRGIAYFADGQVVYTGDRPPLALDSLPFVYADGLDAFKDRIIYFETARGCPFDCQYCLSSAEKGVRFLSGAQTRQRLAVFLQARVRQVKFVDRTFNCDQRHALAVWRYLIEHDNGVTNFHFEIAADLLDDALFDVLKTARKGLFQFEIGVQSLNGQTLETVRRKTNLTKLFENVRRLRALGHIHLHLDLIAGLPGEDYRSFAASFNGVYAARPEQLQLGFLKLLKGSGLRAAAAELGLVYRGIAPYEVLFTKELSYGEMLRIKAAEEMLELYYNAGKFMATLRFVVPLFGDAFLFFETLAAAWREKGYHLRPHKKIELYTFLYEYCLGKMPDAIRVIRDLLRFDLFLCDNIKTLPDWLCADAVAVDTRRFFNDPAAVSAVLPRYHYQQFSAAQMNRMCAIQSFHYPIAEWIEKGGDLPEERRVYILFDYEAGEQSGNAARHARFVDVTAYF